MSDGEPAEKDDTFLDVFRKHDAVMLLIEPETGRILNANPAAEKFYGYTLAELRGMDGAKINALLPGQLSAGGERKHPVFQHKLANGKIRMIEAHVSQIHINGKVVNFSVVHDVSGREQMDAALRESEERYRSLFENMIDGIYRSTHEGRFIDVNPAMVKMFGYSSREEMLEIDIKKELYFLPEERGSHILDTGQQEIEAYRMRRKDGSEIWVEDHGYYVHDERGNIIYHEGMLRDITERKRAEEVLRQRLLELEALYNVSASLRTVQTFDEALPVLLDQTLAAVGTDTGTILLYNPETDDLRDTHPRGWFTTIEDINIKAGEGIAGTVFVTGQPRLSVEFVEDPLTHPVSRSKIPSGWGGACLPIRTGSEIVGVFFVSVQLPRQISAEQMKLLNSLAEIAGVTLHRTRLFDETSRRAREFASLYETSNALSAETELDTMMQVITGTAKKLLNSTSSGMYLFIPAANELELKIDTESYIPAGIRLQVGEGVAGRVAQTRKPLRVNDYSAWEGRSSKYEEFPIRAVLEVPMLYGGELIGVLTVDEMGDSERQFTEADERLLSLFASQAAGAIHSARLRDEALHRLQHLQTLRTIDKAITSSLDLNITLNILLHHVVSQLDVDAADVLMLRKDEQALRYSAGRGFRTRMIEGADVHLNDKYAGRCVMERRIIKILDSAQITDNLPFARLWAEEEFKSCYCVPLIAKGEVKGVMEVYHRSKFTPSDEWLDFLETLAGQAAITIDNTQMFDNVQRVNMELAIAYEATIEGWSRALDLRDKETEGHTRRVTELTMTLAKVVGIPDIELQHIRRGALLHDIGKMGVSDKILLKKGALTEKEWIAMRLHPTLALQMLQPIAYLRQALDIPYCHHEKWDGTGYPRGLKGGQIPLVARIFAVVDVWDALTSSRPYRKAWTKKKALAYIKQQSGKHFDPHIVELFLKTIKEFDIQP
ncbi:MAG: GAF domain-containing protein [Chloroflexi bacterium]|nr:GAF domain-containing protein [Chloroflexota bacterium]